MKKVIRKNETATISLVGGNFGVSVNVVLFDGREFEGNIAEATPQMNYPATHTHYVADYKYNFPLSKEAAEMILAELPSFTSEWESKQVPIRRSYTDDFGNTCYFDDEPVKEVESEEVEVLRFEIEKLEAKAEFHYEREEVREEYEIKKQIRQLRQEIAQLKKENK